MQGKDGKYIFGMVKVGEKGQIVIPQDARKVFGIKPGDSLLVLGDEKQGIAIVKPNILEEFATAILKSKMESPADPDGES